MYWMGCLAALATLNWPARASSPTLETWGSTKFVREPKIVGGYAVRIYRFHYMLVHEPEASNCSAASSPPDF